MTHLAVHSVQVVVEGHSEVSGSARCHMCDERRFAVVHSVVHIHPSLADLHVLETRLHTAKTEGKGKSRGKTEREQGREQGERRGNVDRGGKMGDGPKEGKNKEKCKITD